MRFEWDEFKNQANIIKHGIDFETARLVFERSKLCELLPAKKDSAVTLRLDSDVLAWLMTQDRR